MAMIPAHLKLTAAQELTLTAIRIKAKERHERERKAAKAAGRNDYPALPYECSWAFENAWIMSYNAEARRPFRGR